MGEEFCCVLDKYSVISQVRICIIPLWREAMWEPSVWPKKNIKKALM